MLAITKQELDAMLQAAVETARRETARRCAEIARKHLNGWAVYFAIRSEFGLDD